MAALRVAIDVGSRFHQVAMAEGDGALLDAFRIDHRQASFAGFFARIERQRVTDIRVAMEGTNGWARPLDHQMLAHGWRL